MYKTKHVPNGVDVKTSGLRQEVPRRHTSCPCARWDSSVPVCVLGAVIHWSREIVTCFEGKKQLIVFLNVPVSLGRQTKQKHEKDPDDVLVQLHNFLIFLLSWVCRSVPAGRSYWLRLPPIRCPLQGPWLQGLLLRTVLLAGGRVETDPVH